MEKIDPPHANTPASISVIRMLQMNNAFFVSFANILPILIRHLDRNLNGR